MAFIKLKTLRNLFNDKNLFTRIQLNNHYSNGTIQWNLIQMKSDETFVNKIIVKTLKSGTSFKSSSLEKINPILRVRGSKEDTAEKGVDSEVLGDVSSISPTYLEENTTCN